MGGYRPYGTRSPCLLRHALRVIEPHGLGNPQVNPLENPLENRAYGKAGNGNETETGSGNWKRKLEMETGNGNWKQMGTKDTPITGAMFSS